MKTNKFYLLPVIGIIIVLLSCITTDAPPLGPENTWITSTPEEQGIDSKKLVDLLEQIKQEKIDINSLLIIKNGYLVMDSYFYPFPPDTIHNLHSCTKSVISCLIGIAIDKGFIKSVDTPVISFFPDKPARNLDDNKKGLTLKHLLTMSTGLRSRDSFLYEWEEAVKIYESGDWIQYILDLPQEVKPGTRFEYSNFASFLLSAIIQKTTGNTAEDFTEEHLFGPLGITDYVWSANPGGITLGWGDLRLKSHDLAKFGYLYLNKGMWQNKRIVPAAWVKESTQDQYDTEFYPLKYGYQWWVDRSGYYMALGSGGQHLIILPELDMVVVFFGKLTASASHKPVRLLKTFIIPAIQPKGALPAQAENLALLNTTIKNLQNPVPGRVSSFPELASGVSGKKYTILDNSENNDYKSFTFEFEENRASVITTNSLGSVVWDIGLDNIYISNHTDQGVCAARGGWRDETTFILDLSMVNEGAKWELTFTFEEDKVSIWAESLYSHTRYWLNARVVG